MRANLLRYAKSQSGFTLVELLVASVIAVIVMTGLTSVLFTSWRAASIATSRVEASAQIRNFEFEAYDDFALSGVPSLSGCGSGAPPPCTIVLSGLQASNSTTPAVTAHTVTYTWNGTTVDRKIGANAPNHAATNVTAFSAYVAGRAPGSQTVVVTLTVTVLSYAETQSMRFYPRVNP